MTPNPNLENSAFVQRVLIVSNQLDPKPWHRLGEEQSIDGLRFRVCETRDAFGRAMRGWSLLSPEGQNLGIDAWYCYEDGSYPPSTCAIPAAPESFSLDETIPLHPPSDAMRSTPLMVIDEAEDDASGHKAEQINRDFGALPFFWKEKQLAPFAIDREGDWLRHRALLGEPDLDEVIRIPSAMLTDALRVLWFLSHDPAEWISVSDMKAVDDGEGGQRWVRMTGRERALIIEGKIRAWSGEHVQPQEGMTAVLLFYDIYNRAHSTRAVAKPHEKEDAHESKN